VRYDIAIVGAGAAGCVLAARLSEDPSRSVLLIEAGPDYPDIDSLPDEVRLGYSSPSGMVARSHDWGYVATAGARTENIIRGKLIGGSSAVNAQIYLWGLPYDFDRWVELGHTEWAWAEVEQWFRKVETDLDFEEGHGSGGPIPVRRYFEPEWNEIQSAFYAACRDEGFVDCPDMNRPYATGVGPYPMNNPDGIRVSAAIGFLNPVRDRKNLTISSDTLTSRIRFDGNRATGVDLLRGEEYLSIEADEVIIASGAIGSPLLLQRSGIGDAETLKTAGVAPFVDLSGVGQNLRDHPAVPMRWQTTRQGKTDTHWHQVGLRYTSSGSTDPDDMIVYVAHVRDKPELLMRPTVNLARSKGHLEITSSDPLANPNIDYGMFTDHLDRERMREAIHLCRKLTRHKDFGPHIVNPLQPGEADLSSDDTLDVWILNNATTGHHVSGTCKMGSASDPAAVVDQSGSVHGMEGLRIVDASIMPDCVRANIHATVLMMAEKIGASISYT
jgi:choline dehydrogenase